MLAALLVLGSASVVYANPDSWTAGQQAFEDGDYRAALDYFTNAWDAGLPGPAVQYNIAVSLYKLRRYVDARKSFEEIARQHPKMRVLAEYNLGLVANRLGDADRARAQPSPHRCRSS